MCECTASAHCRTSDILRIHPLRRNETGRKERIVPTIHDSAGEATCGGSIFVKYRAIMESRSDDRRVDILNVA
jgi:hypothetical protein